MFEVIGYLSLDISSVPFILSFQFRKIIYLN